MSASDLAKCVDINDVDLLNHIVFPYCPNLGAAVFFTVLFGSLTILHIVQAVIYKKKYCWVIAMATAWETIGFGTRAANTQHLDARTGIGFGLNVTSTVFVLIAPIWLNAFVYMTFGRMVHYFLPEKKVAGISARFLTLLFVLLDITAFIIQLAGALILSNQDAERKTIDVGLRTYMLGVGIQEFFILCFLLLSVLFRRSALHWPVFRAPQHWQTLLYIIWAALLLISVRIMYRIGEFSGGFDSYAATHEWLVFTWDGLPMFLAMGLFNIYHPAKALVGPDSEFPKLTRQQKRERKQAKKDTKKGGRFARERESSQENFADVPLYERV